MKQTTICLADDHKLMLEGMGTLIESITELKLQGKFTSGKSLLAAMITRDNWPDVILIDIEMPEMDGVETVKALRRLNTQTKIIALTMHDESHFISRMIAAGANGIRATTQASD